MSLSIAATKQYSSLSEHTRSAKDLEYEVFLGVRRDLTKCSAQSVANFSELALALNKNERLWIEIGTQVADADNQLDDALRACLFYLSEFLCHHTSKVLRGDADVSVLVETNVAVLRCLKGTK